MSDSSQAITHPVGVTVFGSCLVRYEPDVASVEASVIRMAEQPFTAFEEVRTRADQTLTALRAHGVQDRDLAMTPPTLSRATAWVAGTQKFLGYQGVAKIEFRIFDLAAVGTILSAVVEAGAEHIARVSLGSTKLRELRAEARRGAVAAARAKAEFYAEAARVRLGAAIHIEDVDPRAMVVAGSHGPDIDPLASDESDTPGKAAYGALLERAAVRIAYAIVG